ncbi:MAG: MATE family efflux transporter [Spirochaetales bacterium]|nr:MATE family efflux transporter [Spirochaetales bacterium]
MDQTAQRTFILTDNLWRVMWSLSWPAVIAMVLFGLNTVFDAIFVGRFVGETALAGVSIAYPLSSLALGIGSLIGVGAGSRLSIALGADDTRTQQRLLGNVNYLALLISAVYTVVALPSATPLVRLMGGTGEALGLGADYFRVTSIGAVLWIYGVTLNMIVRAEGKMKSAALVMGIGLVVNIAFNYLFIVVFGWGVIGAAWGTNIGMAVYGILGFVYFGGSSASFPARPFALYRDGEIVKSILSMGASSLIMMVMSLLQAVVVYNAISRYGSVRELAFYGAVFRILGLLLMPIVGLMRALQPVVGINFGAGHNDRVVKGFWIFTAAALFLILPFWAGLMLFPVQALSLIFPATRFAASSIVNYRIFLLVAPVLPLIFMAMTFYPAIDKGGPAAFIGIVRQFVFYVPVMLILPRLFGIRWIYLGSLLIDIAVVVIAALMVLPELGRLKRGEMRYATEATAR